MGAMMNRFDTKTPIANDLLPWSGCVCVRLTYVVLPAARSWNRALDLAFPTFLA